MPQSRSSANDGQQRERERGFDRELSRREARKWADGDERLEQALREFGTHLLRKFRRVRLGQEINEP